MNRSAHEHSSNRSNSNPSDFDSRAPDGVRSAVSALQSLRNTPLMRRVGVAAGVAVVVGAAALSHPESASTGSGAKLAPESTYVTKAREMAKGLAERGRLTARVEFKESVIPYSTGMANWDFSKQTCIMEIDPAQVAKSPYKDDAGFKFFIYHELAHCELFSKPGGFFAFMGLNKAEQKVMDEFIGMDWFEAEREHGTGLDLATHSHEVYADVHAALWMLEEGTPAKALNPYLVQRQENWMDKIHNSVSAFSVAMQVDPSTLNGERLNEISKEITGEFLMRTQLLPALHINDDEPMKLAYMARQRLKALHTRVEFGGKLTLNDAIAKIETIHPDHLKAYPTYQFIAQQGAATALNTNASGYAQKWEAHVFGDSFEFDKVAASAAQKMHQWGMEKVVSVGQLQPLPGPPKAERTASGLEGKIADRDTRGSSGHGHRH